MSSTRRRLRAPQIARRRRVALGLGLLAVIALGLGVVMGGRAGSGSAGSDLPTNGGEPVAPFAAVPLPALDDGELAGQRLIAGFSGTRPPAGLRRMIRDGSLAGVILFAGNIDGRMDTARMIASLQRIPRPAGLDAPLLVMVDQEGGEVKRLAGPPRSTAAEIGAKGVDYSTRQGAATARSLSALGVNVNLAPVLDLAHTGAAITGERRSFGANPDRVIATAVAGFGSAQQEGGVASTAKHFPGFGTAELNTDDTPQRIDLSRAQLRRSEEAPFAAFARSGGQLVMLSLASYRAFGRLPAALNPALAGEELRGRVGFDGVTITDSLDAAAATNFGDPSTLALAAAGAGTDLLLYPDWREAREAARALDGALSSGQLERAPFEPSVRRVLGLRASLGG